MNTNFLDIKFEEAMAEDRNDIFSDYNDYIMDNADPSVVTICNGDTLLQAAENEYLLEEFKAHWIEKELKTKFTPVKNEEYNNGVALAYKFENGYGASVVSHDGSYGGKRGLWEIAVLDAEGDLCYHTPVTQDVIGHVAEEDIQAILQEISEL